MLPSTRRIHKATFKSFGRALTYHSPLLALFVYKKEDQSESQFSFSCSKKVAKSAVTRNMLRRRGYNAIKKIISTVGPGFYFVFSFKKGAEKASFQETSDQITELLRTSKALHA